MGAGSVDSIGAARLDRKVGMMTWLDERTLTIAHVLREPTAGRRGYTRRLHRVDSKHEGRTSKEDMLRLHRVPNPMVCFPGCLRPIEDLRGSRYRMLTVLGYAGRRGRKTIWACRCDCGQAGIFAGQNLISGRTKSCGSQQHKKGGERADQEHQA